jgi:predicted  nucleic acid-binding Zn-ribbon protein
MSPDLERLIKLQQHESAIADARRRIDAHPQRLQAADDRLSEAKRLVDDVKHRLKENQEIRRTLEKDAAVFQGRLTKFKDQLFEVKTNREYQAIQKEIEIAQGELRAVEDKVLERMIEADGLVVDVKKAETSLATQQKDIEAEKRQLAEELVSTEQSLKDSLAERERLVREIDPHNLAVFEQVMRARRGVAVCPAADGLCSICHVRLRPQVFQEIRRNDSIIQCESCHRILYYVPPPAAAQPIPAHT